MGSGVKKTRLQEEDNSEQESQSSWVKSQTMMLKENCLNRDKIICGILQSMKAGVGEIKAEYLQTRGFNGKEHKAGSWRREE